MVVDYKMSLLAAVVILSVGGLASITLMTILGASVTSISLVGGLITPSIIALLSLIRAETTAKDVGLANTRLSEVQEKVNGHLTEHTEALTDAIQTVASVAAQLPTTEVKPTV